MNMNVSDNSISRVARGLLKNKALKILLRWIRHKRYPYDEFVKLHEYFNSERSNPDGLLLGDSVTERISWHDTNKATLAQILTAALSDTYSVGSVSYSAFNAKIYSYFIEALQVMKRRPKFVVLPVNMRSFSPQWDLEPSWQFDTEINLISKFISDPRRIPDYVPEEHDLTVQYERFDSTPVQYPLSELKRIGHFRLVISGKPTSAEQRDFRLTQLFVFHYAFALHQNHRNLVYLKKSIHSLQKMKIHGVLYVTPINIESGRKYAGDRFVESVRSNMSAVENVVADASALGSVSFFNFGELFPPNFFFHKDETTEHLNQDGRKRLASLLADQIRKLNL
jgi:hypothetical protein